MLQRPSHQVIKQSVDVAYLSWKMILVLSIVDNCQSLGSSLFKVLPLAEGFNWMRYAGRLWVVSTLI